MMCLSLESDEQYCSIEVMEDAFRALDDEMVRGECSPAHEAQIDELWRIIKLCYGGATRREAILARRDILAAAGAPPASRAGMSSTMTTSRRHATSTDARRSSRRAVM